MNQYTLQKQGRKKKEYSMRKCTKGKRALSLSLGSMALIIVMIVVVGGGLVSVFRSWSRAARRFSDRFFSNRSRRKSIQIE